MKKTSPTLAAGAIVLAALNHVYGAILIRSSPVSGEMLAKY